MTRIIRVFLYLFAAASITISIPNDLPHREAQPPGKPNDWFFMQRAFPSGQINQEAYLHAVKVTRALTSYQDNESLWTFGGPVNSGGRLSDVEYHPGKETILAGAASGGIFEVSPDGTAWETIFDDALSLSIGDIALAPSNPDIIYVGTGEANAGGGSQTYDGVGVYRSDDGGDTWAHVGLEESRNIGRIVVHPDDPDIAWVAAMGNLFADNPDRGIYRTTDGGTSWEQVLFVSDSTGGIDLVIDPATPEVLYASMWERIRRPDRRRYGGPTCGIYKTADGGDSWSELTSGLPSPAGSVGRIGIDIAASDPNVLYAIYADEIGYFKGVYKTGDGGASWTQTNDGQLSNSFQSYGWWFGRIEVDPTDPDVAFVIGFDLYKTTNGGLSWSNISSDVHVDQHGLFIHPENNNTLFLANDGGLYISADGGAGWEFLDILPITQFYTCEIDEQYPERLYGGTQDNGTNRTLTGATDDWEHIYGGDGFHVLVDPVNNNFVYAEYQYGGLGRSTNGGLSFSNATNGISNSDRKNWNTPVVFDPADPAVMYYGSNRIYRSVNHASSWTAISGDLTDGPGVNLTYGTVTTIAVSPVNQEIIYAGTDDGNVWVTDDGGAAWDQIGEGLPQRWVTRMAADPQVEDRVFITFSGYRWDEYLPHVFMSDNRGQDWMDLSADLPEIPLNDIIIDPENNNILYVASDAGVFVSKDLGFSWQVMGTNLPLVPVNDLDLHNGTRKLVAATFGRSMYYYDLYQDTVTTMIPIPGEGITGIHLSVVPNPVSRFSRVIIEADHAGTGDLRVLDMTGTSHREKKGLHFPVGRSALYVKDLGLRSLAAGVYILVLDTGAGLSAERFLVGE